MDLATVRGEPGGERERDLDRPTSCTQDIDEPEEEEHPEHDSSDV